MKDRSLQILHALLAPAGGKYKRVAEPMVSFENGFTCGWALCVPESFRSALDIRQRVQTRNKRRSRVWTQGPWFHFQTGGILYDVPEAYGKWPQAIKSVGICIHIVDAAPAMATADGLRDPGYVTFEVFAPNEERTAWVVRNEKTLTQDDFIRMLIAGPPGDWLERRREPAAKSPLARSQGVPPSAIDLPEVIEVGGLC